MYWHKSPNSSLDLFSLYVQINVEIETALPLPAAVINVSRADYSSFKRNQVLSQIKKKDLNGGEAKPSATQIYAFIHVCISLGITTHMIHGKTDIQFKMFKIHLCICLCFERWPPLKRSSMYGCGQNWNYNYNQNTGIPPPPSSVQVAS